jgi:hypothetical protein
MQARSMHGFHVRCTPSSISRAHVLEQTNAVISNRVTEIYQLCNLYLSMNESKIFICIAICNLYMSMNESKIFLQIIDDIGMLRRSSNFTNTL